eukprot:TRINITY_DN14660_c0_g1_i1.p1 TRINITY_DN14660_c0_g1~~TRINITY_DN14660_c0_g1_i1.p1  ORF type:complete len:500 (-),score=98.62 TRINITY_DN14660_c0_g1_i1:151-1650(-)
MVTERHLLVYIDANVATFSLFADERACVEFMSDSTTVWLSSDLSTCTAIARDQEPSVFSLLDIPSDCETKCLLALSFRRRYTPLQSELIPAIVAAMSQYAQEWTLEFFPMLVAMLGTCHQLPLPEHTSVANRPLPPLFGLGKFSGQECRVLNSIRADLAEEMKKSRMRTYEVAHDLPSPVSILSDDDISISDIPPLNTPILTEQTRCGKFQLLADSAITGEFTDGTVLHVNSTLSIVTDGATRFYLPAYEPHLQAKCLLLVAFWEHAVSTSDATLEPLVSAYRSFPTSWTRIPFRELCLMLNGRSTVLPELPDSGDDDEERDRLAISDLRVSLTHPPVMMPDRVQTVPTAARALTPPREPEVTASVSSGTFVLNQDQSVVVFFSDETTFELANNLASFSIDDVQIPVSSCPTQYRAKLLLALSFRQQAVSDSEAADNAVALAMRDFPQQWWQKTFPELVQLIGTAHDRPLAGVVANTANLESSDASGVTMALAMSDLMK